jgi:hypothetical protein
MGNAIQIQQETLIELHCNMESFAPQRAATQTEIPLQSARQVT